MKNLVKVLLILSLLIVFGACEDDYIPTEVERHQVEDPILSDEEQNQLRVGLTRLRSEHSKSADSATIQK